jgi:hypothetical protein
VAKAAVVDLRDGKFVIRKKIMTATREGAPDHGSGSGGQFKNWRPIVCRIGLGEHSLDDYVVLGEGVTQEGGDQK